MYIWCFYCLLNANKPAFLRRGQQGSSALDPESGRACWEEGGPNFWVWQKLLIYGLWGSYTHRSYYYIWMRCRVRSVCMLRRHKRAYNPGMCFSKRGNHGCNIRKIVAGAVVTTLCSNASVSTLGSKAANTRDHCTNRYWNTNTQHCQTTLQWRILPCTMLLRLCPCYTVRRAARGTRKAWCSLNTACLALVLMHGLGGTTCLTLLI